MLKGTVQQEMRCGLDIAHVAQDLGQIVRNTRDIHRDDNEYFFLIVQEEGRALMSQNGYVRMIGPGDMILIDSARPSEFTFFGTFNRQLSMHLPRREMQERFRDRLQGGLFLRHDDQTAVAITAVLAKAFSVGTTDSQTSYLREALLGLIGVVLHQRTDDWAGIDTEAPGAQLLQRSLSYIDSRCSDPEMTVVQMADDLRTSPRQVQRAFALLSTTPTNYLLQKRMERACALLAERTAGRNDLLISSIAMECGFNDISNFNRQFRRMFGCAPGQYGCGD